MYSHGELWWWIPFAKPTFMKNHHLWVNQPKQMGHFHPFSIAIGSVPTGKSWKLRQFRSPTPTTKVTKKKTQHRAADARCLPPMHEAIEVCHARVASQTSAVALPKNPTGWWSGWWRKSEAPVRCPGENPMIYGASTKMVQDFFHPRKSRCFMAQEWASRLPLLVSCLLGIYVAKMVDIMGWWNFLVVSMAECWWIACGITPHG